MEEAERIAREEHGSGRIAVISGKLTMSGMDRNPKLIFLRSGHERLLPTSWLLSRRTLHGQGLVVR